MEERSDNNNNNPPSSPSRSASSNEAIYKLGKKGETKSGAKHLKTHPEQIESFLQYTTEAHGIEDTLEWVSWIIAGGNLKNAAPLVANKSSGVCGRTWLPGDIAFKCKTCEKDPTCAICAQCFYAGNHEGHDYAMVTNSSGMCDCGDVESWSQEGFCVHHKGPGADPLVGLPADLVTAATKCCIALVKQLYGIISYLSSAPVATRSREEHNKIEKEQERALLLILWMGKKIESSTAMKRILGQALCSKADTTATATATDNDNDNDANNAQQERGPDDTYLDLLISHDPVLVEPIANALTDNIYLPLFVDMEFKKRFAKTYVRFYEKLIGVLPSPNQTRSSRQGRHSITSTSVQIFTVPSLVSMLCRESRLLETFFETIEHITARVTIEKDGRAIINYTTPSFKTSLYWEPVHDLKYTLMHKDISERLLFENNAGSPLLARLCNFLSTIQGSWQIERIDSDDDTWSKSFILEIQVSKLTEELESGVHFHITNGSSNDNNNNNDDGMKRVMEQFCTSLMNVFKTDHSTLDKTTPTGNPRVPEVIDFDVVQGPITFHLPLHRFMASLMHSYTKAYDSIGRGSSVNLTDLFAISSLPSNFISLLIEFPLRLQVVRSHIRARLWPRNNMQITHQLINYEIPNFHDYARMFDIFLLQVASILAGPQLFLTTALNRFQINKIPLFLFGTGNTDAEAKQTHESYLTILEDFITFVLTIYSDRTYAGASREQILRKYIVHNLFLGKQSHSKLLKVVPERWSDEESVVDEVIRQVSDFHKARSVNEQAYFTVRKECWDELDPYFAHYNRSELHQVEDSFKQHCQRAGTLAAHGDVLPIKRPQDTFESLRQLFSLIHCDILHKVIYCVLYNTLIKSSFSSDRLLTSALHLLIVSMETLRDHAKNKSSSDHHSTDTDANMATTTTTTTKKSKVEHIFDLEFPSTDDLITNVKYAVKVDTTAEDEDEDEAGAPNSILSLLLKLRDRADLKEKRPCIENIVSRLCKLDTTGECSAIVAQYEDKRKQQEAQELAEKRRKEQAKKRQQAIMARMSANQKKFEASSADVKKVDEVAKELTEEEEEDELMRQFGEKVADVGAASSSSSSTEEQQSVNLLKDATCAICLAAISPRGSKTLGLISHLSRSSVLSLVQQQNFVETFGKNEKRHPWLATEEENSDSPADFLMGSNKCNSNLFHNINTDHGTHIHMCGHVMHFDCFNSFFYSMLDSNNRGRRYKGMEVVDLGRCEFLCPLCGRMANCICPMMVASNAPSTPSNGNNHHNNNAKDLGAIDFIEEINNNNNNNNKQNADANPATGIDILKVLQEDIESFEKFALPATYLQQQQQEKASADNTEYSLDDSLDTFALRISCVQNNKWGDEITMSDEDDVDLSISVEQLHNTIAYNVGILEVDQRMHEQDAQKKKKSSPLSPLRIEELRMLVRAVHAYKKRILLMRPHQQKQMDEYNNELNKQVTRLKLLLKTLTDTDFKALFENIKSKKEAKEKKDGELDPNKFLPLLSCDLFSLLVQIVLSRPRAPSSRAEYLALVKHLFGAAAVQAHILAGLCYYYHHPQQKNESDVHNKTFLAARVNEFMDSLEADKSEMIKKMIASFSSPPNEAQQPAPSSATDAAAGAAGSPTAAATTTSASTTEQTQPQGSTLVSELLKKGKALLNQAMGRRQPEAEEGEEEGDEEEEEEGEEGEGFQEEEEGEEEEGGGGGEAEGDGHEEEEGEEGEEGEGEGEEEEGEFFDDEGEAIMADIEGDYGDMLNADEYTTDEDEYFSEDEGAAYTAEDVPIEMDVDTEVYSAAPTNTLPTSSSASSSDAANNEPPSSPALSSSSGVPSKFSDFSDTYNKGQDRIDTDAMARRGELEKGLCLNFLRRVAIFTLVLFQGSPMPPLRSNIIEDATNEDDNNSSEKQKQKQPLHQHQQQHQQQQQQTTASFQVQPQFDDLIKYLELSDIAAELFDSSSDDNNNNNNKGATHSLVSHLLDQLRSAIKLSLSMTTVVGSVFERPDPLLLLPPRTGMPLRFHLIPVPRLYQPIYQRYHSVKCPRCKSRDIKYPSICLVTGRLAWIGDCMCSQQLQRVGKLNRHAQQYTGGIGLFLVVPLTSVLVMRDTRHTFLVSPYIDSHGEQDLGLKRGKPLYLDETRYDHLVRKFVNNSWDQDTQVLEITRTRDTLSF